MVRTIDQSIHLFVGGKKRALRRGCVCTLRTHCGIFWCLAFVLLFSYIVFSPLLGESVCMIDTHARTYVITITHLPISIL